MPFSGSELSPHLCAQCLRRPPAYQRAQAAFEYVGVVPKILHAAKFRRELAGLAALAQASVELIKGILQEFPVDGMVPVPLSSRRQWRRGFNQSVVLARLWQQGALVKIPILVKGIQRTHQPPQARQELKTRWQMLRGAFRVGRPQEIAGKNLLIVDDVMTTGATVEAFSECLLGAGAKSIQVLALARVPTQTQNG